MLAGLLLLITVTLRCFPETAAARWVQRAVIDATRGRLAAIERRHIILLVLIPIMLVAGAEMLAMLGSTDLAMLVMLDMASYVDIVVTGAVVTTMTRIGAGIRTVRNFVVPRRGVRAHRTRPARKALPSANDDDDRAVFLRAA